MSVNDRDEIYGRSCDEKANDEEENVPGDKVKLVKMVKGRGGKMHHHVGGEVGVLWVIRRCICMNSGVSSSSSIVFIWSSSCSRQPKQEH